MESPFKSVVRRVQNQADMKRVARFRYSVYVEELKRENFGYMDNVDRIMEDPFDKAPGCINLFVEEGEDVVGAMRLHVPIPTEYIEVVGANDEELFPGFTDDMTNFSFGSRFMVRPDRRGPKYDVSPALYAAMWQESRKAGAHFFVGHCTPALLTMYERKGFVRYTDCFYDQTGKGLQVPILFCLDDLEFIQKIDKRTTYGMPVNVELGEPDGTCEPPAAELDEAGKLLQTKISALGKAWLANLLKREPYFVNASLYDGAALKEFLSTRVPLLKMPLFKTLSEEDIIRFFSSALCPVVTVKARDVITNIGDVRDEAFIILSGKLVRDTTKYLVRGDLAGEMTFLSGRKRCSNVRAVEHTELLVMSRVGFIKNMTRCPDQTVRILFNLSKRVSRHHVEYTEMTRQRIEECEENGYEGEPLKALKKLVQSPEAGDSSSLEPDEWELARHRGWNKLKKAMSATRLLKSMSGGSLSMLAKAAKEKKAEDEGDASVPSASSDAEPRPPLSTGQSILMMQAKPTTEDQKKD